MEYHQIPAVIKSLKDNMTRCGYVTTHDIPRYRNDATNEIKITVGDRTVSVGAKELENFLLEQVRVSNAEVDRLEEIHSTFEKVAVGLLK